MKRRVESPFRSKDSAQPRWFPPAAWQGGFSHLCLCQQQSNPQTNSTALSSKSAGQWYFHKIQTLHTGDTQGDALCSSLISLQFPTEQTSSSATGNRQRSKQARHCCESLREPRMKFCTYLHLPAHLSAALLFSLSPWSRFSQKDQRSSTPLQSKIPQNTATITESILTCCSHLPSCTLPYLHPCPISPFAGIGSDSPFALAHKLENHQI